MHTLLYSCTDWHVNCTLRNILRHSVLCMKALTQLAPHTRSERSKLSALRKEKHLTCRKQNSETRQLSSPLANPASCLFRLIQLRASFKRTQRGAVAFNAIGELPEEVPNSASAHLSALLLGSTLSCQSLNGSALSPGSSVFCACRILAWLSCGDSLSLEHCARISEALVWFFDDMETVKTVESCSNSSITLTESLPGSASPRRCYSLLASPPISSRRWSALQRHLTSTKPLSRFELDQTNPILH